MDEKEVAKRRAAARRTAIGLVTIAALVYLMFVISGVVGR